MLKRIIKTLRSYGGYSNHAYNWEMCDYSDHAYGFKGWNRTKTDRFIRCSLDYVAQLLRIIYCGVVGHALVDDSCIGPDSGTESHYCTRCGYSWSHTYY
jgi:hypothetical protein